MNTLKWRNTTDIRNQPKSTADNGRLYFHVWVNFRRALIQVDQVANWHCIGTIHTQEFVGMSLDRAQSWCQSYMDQYAAHMDSQERAA